MTTSAIGHHPETPRGDVTGGSVGGRRAQPLVTERSSWVTMTALSFLALIGGAAAQYTGTYYPEAPVNVGTGSDPLLISGPVTQLLFGNGGSLRVGDLNLVGALEGSSVKEIDGRTPHHSKHVVTYPNGNYGLALEVPGTFFDIEACRWDSSWTSSLGCTPIYSGTAAGLHNVDIAGSANSTMVTFQNTGPTTWPLTYFVHLDSDFNITVPATRVTYNSGTGGVGTAGRDRNPSPIWLGDNYRVVLEGDHTIHPSRWTVRSREYSGAGVPLSIPATISGSIDNNSPDGPPDLKLSNLGDFGHVEAWQSKSPSPNGHYAHFEASDSTDLGTLVVDSSANAHSGIFTEINPTMVAGAWARDGATNEVRLELFERSGNSVAPVASSSFTVFDDSVDVFASVSVAAIPNEAGVVVTAEKAGFIWTRVIYFNPLTGEPTPLPTQTPTPLPTKEPTGEPTPAPPTSAGTPAPSSTGALPPTPAPAGSTNTEGSTSSGPAAPGTEEDTSGEGSSTGNGHTFTAMTPAPPTPATVTLMRKVDEGKGSPLGLIVGITVGAVACSAIAVGVVRSRRRHGSRSLFRRGRSLSRIVGAASGRASRLASRSSSPDKNSKGPQAPGTLAIAGGQIREPTAADITMSALYVPGPTLGPAAPQGGVKKPGLPTPKSEYGALPQDGQASPGIHYDVHVPLTGHAPAKGEYTSADLVKGGQQKPTVNYDVHVPLTGIAPPKGEYDSTDLGEGGKQKSDYVPTHAPLKV